jgi:hypothetical protein
VSFLLVALLLLGVVKEEYSVEPRAPEFAIYCVSAARSAVDQLALDELPLRDTPYLSEDQIKSYDWTTHTIHVAPGVLENQVHGQLFVVVVGDVRMYRGTFIDVLSSSDYPGPAILDPFMPTGDGSFRQWWIGDEDQIRIRMEGGTWDPRFDERLYDHLESSGLLVASE